MSRLESDQTTQITSQIFDGVKSLKKQLGFISSTPEENLLSDLRDILQQVLNEEETFKSNLLGEGEKEKRLMYLFIRDLLPGLN